MFSYSQVEIGAKLKKSSYSKIEKGLNASGMDKIGNVIQFFGFEYHEFFNFNKPLSNEAALKRKMERFHKSKGWTAYKIIYTQTDLSEVIEHRLLPAGHFDVWTDVEKITSVLENDYGYTYTNISASLIGAVNNKLLISRKKKTEANTDYRHNEYKKNPKAGEG